MASNLIDQLVHCRQCCLSTWPSTRRRVSSNLFYNIRWPVNFLRESPLERFHPSKVHCAKSLNIGNVIGCRIASPRTEDLCILFIQSRVLSWRRWEFAPEWIENFPWKLQSQLGSNMHRLKSDRNWGTNLPMRKSSDRSISHWKFIVSLVDTSLSFFLLIGLVDSCENTSISFFL